MKHGLALCILLLCLSAPMAALGQTGTFTYQGRLVDGGQPAHGSYDFQFALADAATNGSYVGATVTQPAVAVANGLFTVLLDFGGAAFDGSARWLEIGVRTNGSEEGYTVLSPRQAITATPYAAFANAAATLPAGSTVALNGAAITNLNGGNLQPGTVTSNALDSATRAQLALAGSSGGLTNGGGVTNLTLAGTVTFRTGTSAITLTPTDVSANTLVPDWSSIYVSGSTVNQVNGVYTLQDTNAGTSEATWTNSTGDCLVRQNVLTSTTSIETLPKEELLYQGGLLSTYPQLLSAVAAGDEGCYAATATNPAPHDTTPMLLFSGAVKPNPSAPAWIVDAATGDDGHAARGFIPYKTLAAAVSNAAAGDVIYVRKGTYANEPSTVHVPVPNLAIIGEGPGTLLSNAGFAPVLFVNDGLYLSHLGFYRWLFVGAGTNITFEHVNVSGPDTADVVIMDGDIDQIRFFNCDFRSAWDAIALHNAGTPGTVEVWDCKLTTVGALSYGGMHPLCFDGNLMVKVHGGEINLTNNAALPENAYNSCVMIPEAGGAGTNTLVLLGTALNFSDVSGTNAFAVVRTDTNQIVQGWFMANGVLNTVGGIVTNCAPTLKP